MLKRLPALFIVLSISVYSQDSMESQLDSINDELHALEFIESHKANKGKIIVFNTEKHKTRIANDIYKLSVGGKQVYDSELQKTYYKVLEKYDVPHHRMSYVLLNKNELSQSECDDLTQLIKAKFERGYKMSDLASQYSMDDNAYRGGDSGWFTSGTYFDEIENALDSNTNTGIMVVDITSENYRFLILKTHDLKQVEEIKVLKFTEQNSR